MIEPTFLPAPKIAETRFQSKIPTSPQFKHPTNVSTNATMFTIAIFFPPIIVLCKTKSNMQAMFFEKNLAIFVKKMEKC